MTELDELQSLLERVEKATGPDRELDFRIHIDLVDDVVWPVRDRHGRVTNPNYRMSDYLREFTGVIDSDDQDFDFPRYTASIDAALALVEQVLPGRDYEIQRDIDGWYFRIRPSGSLERMGSSLKANLPLAILAALLKALIAQKQGTTYTVGDPEGRKGEE